jgi:PBP1b-binding outer membrane lipoprotein LpoB
MKIYILLAIIALTLTSCVNSLPDRTPPNVTVKNVAAQTDTITIGEDYSFSLELYIEDKRNLIQTVVINTMLKKTAGENFEAVTDELIIVDKKSYSETLEVIVPDNNFDKVGEYDLKVYISVYDNQGNGETFVSNEIKLYKE